MTASRLVPTVFLITSQGGQMNRIRSILSLTAITTAALCAAAPATTLAEAPTSSTPSAAQLASLTPSELALFESDAPKAILMDPTTGDILSVTPAAARDASISHHSVCNSGDGCYRTNNGGDSDQGFYGGAGTVHGTWYDRSGYSAGKWTVSACWSGGCGVTISPGSSVSFTSDVTGTSFTNH